MSALEEASPRGVASATGKAGKAAMAAADGVNFVVVVAQLVVAGARLRGLSEQVRATYRYVEGCSTSVDRLADQMAGLKVDRDTVAEHREAAAVMRGVLEEAEAMAAATEDLAALFDQTSAEHQADYGPVAEAFHAMPVEPAESEFYSNR